MFRGCVIVFAMLLALSTLAGESAPAGNSGPGKILCKYWREIPGTAVADLLKNPAYPNSPTEQVFLDKFEIPENQENNFGTIISGYVHPPADGAYTFFISADEQGELWLSESEDSSKIKKIAEVPEWSLPKKWDQNELQTSKPVTLKAGKKYYIEARHKDGGGDNNLAVAWKMPDGKMEEPIPGSRLSPAEPTKPPPPKITLDAATPLPTTPGQHKLRFNVTYMAQKVTIPVLITMPQDFTAGSKRPALLFIQDADPKIEGDGFRLQGPDQAWATKAEFKEWYRFIGISPQCPAGKDWTSRIVFQGVQGIVEELLEKLPVDRTRVYLTGAGAGGTMGWRLASEKSELYAGFAPICGGEVNEKDIVAKLKGLPIYIITGVKNGFATSCANKMKELLATNQPQPGVYYEMEMGSEVVDKVFTQGWFWNWMLAQRRGPLETAAKTAAQPAAASSDTGSAASAGVHTKYISITLGAGAALFILALVLLKQKDLDPVAE